MRRLSRVVAVCVIAALLLPAGLAHGRGHSHGMSPRGFSGASLIFGVAAAQMAQRRAWEAREAAAEAARRARNNAERMKYADQARKEGKPRLAAMLYLRVALAKKPKSPYSPKAKKALTEMADQGRAEMKKADELLASGEVSAAFEKLDYLNWAYENVPQFNEEIASHVSRLRRDRKYLAILNEDGAAKLLSAAKKHEADDEMCCAFLVYEEAAKLVPAKSAEVAASRLAELKADPKVVEEAKECKAIQECLHIFHTAELLEKKQPERAAELFKQILGSSPADSEVYKCAREELAKIARH